MYYLVDYPRHKTFIINTQQGISILKQSEFKQLTKYRKIRPWNSDHVSSALKQDNMIPEGLV